jgi:hypothetical protein
MESEFSASLKIKKSQIFFLKTRLEEFFQFGTHTQKAAHLSESAR